MNALRVHKVVVYMHCFHNARAIVSKIGILAVIITRRVLIDSIMDNCHFYHTTHACTYILTDILHLNLLPPVSPLS